MLVTVGAGLLLVGLLVWWGGFGWFGRLPGDIRIERETVRVYIPITSMVLISLVLNALLWLVRKLGG
jgi:hypothetical protein